MSAVCVTLLGSLWAGCALQARGRLTRFVDGACGQPSDGSAVGVFRGLPRVGLVERALDGRRCKGTCCRMRAFSRWDVLPTYRDLQFRHSNS